MAKKKDYMVIGIIALGAGYLVYDVFIKNKNGGYVPPVPPAGSTQVPVSIAPVVTTPAASSYSYPIVYGKYHPDVKKLQAILGVTQDGIIGPQTLAALQLYSPGVTKDIVFYSEWDLTSWGYDIVQMQTGNSGGLNQYDPTNPFKV